MIRLQNVSKSFWTKEGERVVVRDLTMAIPRGRNLALLGRNGAGKSTFLRMISGEVKPDRGRIVRDCQVSWPLGFAGSFQKTMTGRQNVRFVARVYGVDVEALIAYVAEFSELGAYLDMPVASYSSGMRARLSFGISMGVKFDVYLVDETLAVGDENFKLKCRRVFQSRMNDCDVIMVAHSPAVLRAYCDCGLVLEHGRMEYYDHIDDAILRHQEHMRASREEERQRRTQQRAAKAT